METIQLSSRVLDWAALQADLTLYDLAHEISKRDAERIVNGILTNAQVIKFAKKTRVALGDLFLDEPPPPRKLPIADFRTVQFASPLGKDFFETFDDIEYKQLWYRERLSSDGVEPLDFVGKFHRDRPAPSVIADDMRAVLDFYLGYLKSLRNAGEVFSFLAEQCEKKGILIFKNGVVGNKTKRSLSVGEFRGFVLADNVAPAIFINGADAPAAWVFTLAHELAHLWLGHSGVSDSLPESDSGVERYCNSVAAEFLVPAESFFMSWNSLGGLGDISKIESVRKEFKVSGLVIARRALDLGVIDYDIYNKFYDIAKFNRGSEESGGDFYRTLAVRNSKKFSKEVANLAISGQITLGQAGRLLNTNPNNVVKFYARQNAISI
ncbi:ImmA/IrrE family metallo-endopeptidase [Chromobacterium violaceum]|uniref:IrrE N-terminal-like domain-containing protein n=1 Tax=Chromobacterium violaceum TaxID=536 RepID=A0A202BB39_CHRVL|nr:ImmA/IrrE family metallo-endopeptidase [Chromobacterium violaceum]MBA8736923.1 ImmA/IrrE family metallo-endopeptidase [Chromobacterium violaceum]OVE48754.1 hypothetical protein CBW21_09415 [Chromobacterium violaceum]